MTLALKEPPLKDNPEILFQRSGSPRAAFPVSPGGPVCDTRPFWTAERKPLDVIRAKSPRPSRSVRPCPWGHPKAPRLALTLCHSPTENNYCGCCCCSCCCSVTRSCPTLCPPGPLSVGFPRQGHWSGLAFPSPGELPDPGVTPASPALAGGFSDCAIWEAHRTTELPTNS